MKYLIPIILLILTTLTSCDPENDYFISGKIVDREGVPIENTNISFICYPVELKTKPKKTDANGLFNDTIVSLRKYDSIELLLNKKGFVSKTINIKKDKWDINRSMMKIEFKFDFGEIQLEKIDNRKSIPEKKNIKLTDIEKKIGTVALSFHNWFIKNELNSDVATDFIIVKGENGKCKVDYQPFFKNLRELGTISETFINNEIKRTKDCVDFLNNLDWKEYEKAEGYEYDEYCAFMYYKYWTQSQEETDGIEVTEIIDKNDYWIVKASLYILGENNKHFEVSTADIFVIKEKEKYLITEIRMNV